MDQVVAADVVQLVVVVGRLCDLDLADCHDVDIVLLHVFFNLQLFPLGNKTSTAVPAAQFDTLLSGPSSVTICDVHVFVG